MFEKEYAFYGEFAEKVNQLTSSIFNNVKIFNRNVDVLLIAPLVGFLFNSKAEMDTKRDVATKVFVDMLNKEEERLLFVIRLILLLDKDYEPSLEKRFDLAFRYLNVGDQEKDNECMKLFNQYVCGGINVLYERIIEENKASSAPEYLENVRSFLDDVQQRFNEGISADDIIRLHEQTTKRRN